MAVESMINFPTTVVQKLSDSAQLKAGAMAHKCEVEAGGLEFQVKMYNMNKLPLNGPGYVSNWLELVTLEQCWAVQFSTMMEICIFK